jgi:hypothetical protein
LAGAAFAGGDALSISGPMSVSQRAGRFRSARVDPVVGFPQAHRFKSLFAAAGDMRACGSIRSPDDEKAVESRHASEASGLSAAMHPAAHNPNHAVVPGGRLKLSAQYARKGDPSQQ